MSKTVKFTYEGSNKFCKIIYLIGLTIAKLGEFAWIIGVFYGIYSIFTPETHDFEKENIAVLFIMLLGTYIITQIVGNLIISLSQLINWWDRGSVNTKITRNLK